MSTIKGLERAKLRQLEAGQHVGQTMGQQVSHYLVGNTPLWDTPNPQETAKIEQVSHCPTPIGTGRWDTPQKTGTPAGTIGGTVGALSDGVGHSGLR